jgi:15-cis-phytoene synthase
MLLSSPEIRFATTQDQEICRTAIRHGSHTFYAASLLLPPSVRQPAYGLYAFCRLSDDAIDLEGGSMAALLRLQDRLARIYSGNPHDAAADRAMADVVRRFAIPAELPQALLDGLAWDAQGRRFETLSDVFDYAARVAGTVGVMMTLMMGVRSPQALARACDLGVAMQLTNIARDVGEDARAGRIYLPLDWLRESGIDPDAFLATPRIDSTIRLLVARLLGEADKLYARARGGIACLPLSCRPAIMTAGLLYAEIGRAVERLNHDSINQRAFVPRRQKMYLLSRAVIHTPFLKQGAAVAPLAEVSYLIEAVQRANIAWAHSQQIAQAKREPQVLRVLAIFERMERQRRMGEYVR